MTATKSLTEVVGAQKTVLKTEDEDNLSTDKYQDHALDPKEDTVHYHRVPLEPHGSNPTPPQTSSSLPTRNPNPNPIFPLAEKEKVNAPKGNKNGSIRAPKRCRER